MTAASEGVDSDPDNGHEFVNNGRTLIYATSDSEEARALHFRVATQVDGLSVQDLVVWVPALGGVFVGPFPGSYNQSNRRVYIDVDGNAEDLSMVGISLR